VWERHLDGVDGADEVGVDAVGPRLHRRGALHGGDAGLGDDDVEVAQLGDPVVQRLLERSGVSHVDLGGDRLAARLLDVLGGLLEVFRPGQRVAHGVDVGADVDGDDVGAFLGQPDGVAAALTARCAGDECDLALNASHSGVLSFFRRCPAGAVQVFRPPLTPKIWPVM
jgi:hypothetical protein